MVVDTIKTIKGTEKEADLLIEEADKKCKAVLERATEEAARLKEAAVAEGRNQAEFAMQEAKVQGNEMLEHELKIMNEQAEWLNHLVTAKEDEAIQAIIEGLI